MTRRGSAARSPLVLGLVALVCFAAAALPPARAGAPKPDGMPRPSADRPHFRFFSPRSFWNRAGGAHPRPAARSRGMVRMLAASVREELASDRGPTINTARWSVPIYRVPLDQPTVRVLLKSPDSPALQQAWEHVPLPPDAVPAAGSDHHLVVWQPASDRLWEFWRLRRGANGWEAGWGGAMERVSENSGSYGPGAWPGATYGWGASASSLSIAGGLITLADLRRGWINHALAMAVPEVRAGVFAPPAHRTDGESSDPLALPEGAHLRLDPRLDLSSRHLPRLTRMIARAAQRYGIYVRSRAAIVVFYGQDPTTAGENPYLGRVGYLEGRTPSELLSRFPWRHLEVMRMRLRS